MRHKHRVSAASLRPYYWIIGISVVLLIFFEVLKGNPDGVEEYYARAFYPVFSYLYIVLFSWVPFSVGDLIYGAIILLFGVFSYSLAKSLWHRNTALIKKDIARLLSFGLVVYSLFYLNWGMNYFRLPLTEQLKLKTDSISKDDYLVVLDKYIITANKLRDQFELADFSKNGVIGDLKEIVRADKEFKEILALSQVQVKSPLSSKLVSYFGVSGYFNPFTLEAHVNQNIPNSGFPFTVVHELMHQQGIGFEDECNFLAFVLLQGNKDSWYQYSAYYSAIQYLMRPLYSDEQLFKQYRDKLSPKVLQDFKEEREFWEAHQGWIDRLSGIFYNQYLKHNNQPEGMERYGMMVKLLVAWEKKNLSTSN